jgi:hypothetical protein
MLKVILELAFLNLSFPTNPYEAILIIPEAFTPRVFYQLSEG